MEQMDVKDIAKEYISFALKVKACEDLVLFLEKLLKDKSKEMEEECKEKEECKDESSPTGLNLNVYQDMAIHFKCEAIKRAKLLHLNINNILPIEEFCKWMLNKYQIFIDPDDEDNIYY